MVKSLSELGRRERQIMDIVVRRGRATAADVLADLDDPPSYSAVRGMLRLLEDKGYISHEWDGPRHVCICPAIPLDYGETPCGISLKHSSMTPRNPQSPRCSVPTESR